MKKPGFTFAICCLITVCAFSQTTNLRRPTAKSGSVYQLPPNFKAQAAKYMQERVRVTGFSGAILVAHRGQPVFRQSYGLANHEFSIPNTPATKFRVGSAGKQFTS
ncbi:MAG: serine hydrolase, partial [Blastocatellia bacterium]|nr:serine hydrolase [Blastocatellia bacterium]